MVLHGCPPSFVPLRCAAPTPAAVDGFCAVYTQPVAGRRDADRAATATSGGGGRGEEDEDGGVPPSSPPKADEDEGEEGEEAESTTLMWPSAVAAWRHAR